MNLTLRNLLVAALLMMVGILLVTSFIRGERRSLSRGKQEVQVYVAAKDIPAGTPAKDLQEGGYLETKDVLREDAPPQAIGKLSTIESLVSNSTVYEGEVVSYTAFDKTAGLKPAAQIKGNQRIFSVGIPAANDAASMIKPGNRVDIYAVFGVQSSMGQIKQMTVVARDIEIMSTPESLVPDGQEEDPAAPEAKGDAHLYVLKATDKEAANILFGQSAADDHGLIFLLRPDNGDTATDIPPMIGPVEPKVSDSQVPKMTGRNGNIQIAPDPSVS